MNVIIVPLVISCFFLLYSQAFAEKSDLAVSDTGVLVSPPVDGGSGKSSVLDQSDQTEENNVEVEHSDETAESSSLNNVGNKSLDPIIVKSTDFIMTQITLNMKLSAGQINAVRFIIQDNVIKSRELQDSLKEGDIDAKAIYARSQDLIAQENRRLSNIFNQDQMRAWLNIQGDM